MKKILFVIALVVTMVYSASAQNDGFFRGGDNNSGYRATSETPGIPGGAAGTIPDTNAPIGSGLLVFTALGAAYALAGKRNSYKKNN